jgi:hypothetical protein
MHRSSCQFTVNQRKNEFDTIVTVVPSVGYEGVVGVHGVSMHVVGVHGVSMHVVGVHSVIMHVVGVHVAGVNDCVHAMGVLVY